MVSSDDSSNATRLIYSPPEVTPPGQNKLVTSRYHWWNFIPMTLWEQFHRLCNIFFLATAIMQVFPEISPFDPVSGFLSIAFMLFLTALKNGYEDYRKHKADDIINNKTVQILQRDGTLTTKIWENVCVGEIIKIENDGEFPADVVLINVQSSDGRCRIETAALDGETNLKFKSSIHGNIMGEKLEVQVSAPCVQLSVFQGTIVAQNQCISADINNFVPRGCFLKKTPFVYGLVVYTGNDAKVILNSTKPHFKFTYLDTFLDKMAIFLGLVLLIICISFTIANYFWTVKHQEDQYLMTSTSTVGSYFLQALSWILVLNSIIPLSMYTSLDLVRFFLAQTINQDKRMRDGGLRTRCRNSDLVCAIGRVTHIFSDKTGTLTKNRMTFRSVAFSDTIIGLDQNTTKEEDIQESVNSERLVSMAPENIQWIKDHIDRQDVKDFLLTIILCNSAVSMSNSTSYTLEEIREVFPNFEFPLELPEPHIVAKFPYLISYQSPSPDELALLHFARECGYILYSSTGTTVCVIVNGELQLFNRPIVFDFTSARKRMSVLAKSQADSEYTLYCKGADNVVLSRSTCDEEFLESLQKITDAGLRSLVFASKVVKDAQNIITEYNKLKTLIERRDEAVFQFAEQIEQDFQVFAFSGVEDELQDNIHLSLQRLRFANVRTWMLTGDKLDTAINIALSSGLIHKTHKIAILTFDDCINHYTAIRQLDFSTLAIAIEGSTVNEIITNDDYAPEFFEIAKNCVSVVCARCEPCQKGNIVRSFMKNDPSGLALAIGDGANDVDMIRAAHVGVGVEGNEGSEAVMSSDFSIPSFQFLTRLLIVHGRWCTNRSALLVLLTFYKSAIIVITQILYGCFNGFSAMTAFDSGFNTMFNIVLTIPQLFFICVFEEDIDAKYALAIPQIYIESQQKGGLGLWKVLRWYGISLCHALLIFFFSYFESSTVLLSNDSYTFDWACYAQITGWTIIFVFTIMLLLRFRTLTVVHILLYLLCLFAFALVELIYSYTDPTLTSILSVIFSMPRIWFSIPFVLGTVIMFDMIVRYIKPLFVTSISDAVAELQHAANAN